MANVLAISNAPNKSYRWPRLWHLAIVGLLWHSLGWAQTDTASARQELKQVEQDIAKQQQKQQAQQQALQNAQIQLKKADTALAETLAAVRQQQQALKDLSSQQQALQQQQQALFEQRQHQQKLLAAQLKAAYQIGGHDYTQLLLNQQNALTLERTLTYYQYFNKARLDQLQQLKQTEGQIATLEEELSQQASAQQNAMLELEQRQQALAMARRQQQQSITELKALLKERAAQIAYLEENAKSLKSTLAKLKEAAAMRRQQMLKKPGQLPWPVTGPLRQRFGSQQGGESLTSGIVIAAAPGTAVKAVATGQVIYADWLRGYGWVLVVDHGQGIMTLYGQNQSLLKQAGEEIKAGDVIAYVGQSGGQGQAGLYFEVRQKGSAVDPLLWLRNR